MCTDSSWGEDDDDGDDGDNDDDDDEGATSAAVDAAGDDSRDLRRAVDAGARAIDPESGSSLPVAVPVESNDNLGACRRGRLLRTVTPNSAASRARRTLICPGTGGRRNLGR